jgi:hypothetical protein
LNYCAEQENGGVIANCADWKDRQWQQTAGVMRDEVHRDSTLWRIIGGDLHVWAYPMDQQLRTEKSRASGRDGAATRWGAPKGKRKKKAPPPVSDKPPTFTRRGAALVGDEIVRDEALNAELQRANGEAA